MSSHTMSRAFGALLIAGGLALTAAPAHALGGASRTWVSGVGDEANPCSRTAPCKTWAGAISKTADGGEIDALDPGGFGALTITQSITIDGGGGQVASTLTSGTNGFIIATTGNVVIRNLAFEDVGSGAGCTLAGISIQSAHSVTLDHVSIGGYDHGVSILGSTELTANDLAVNNARCTGINASPAAGQSAKVSLSNSRLTNDNVGFKGGAGSTSWLATTTLSANSQALAGPGTLHDMCGNVLAGNASDGAFTDHAATCQPPATGTSAGTPAVTPTVTYCVVPNLKGRTKAAASAALTAQHCVLGATHRTKAPRNKRGKVLSQTVPAGISVKEGTAVGVTVGK